MCLRGVLRTPEEFRLKVKRILNGSKKVSFFVFPQSHQSFYVVYRNAFDARVGGDSSTLTAEAESSSSLLCFLYCSFYSHVWAPFHCSQNHLLFACFSAAAFTSSRWIRRICRAGILIFLSLAGAIQRACGG